MKVNSLQNILKRIGQVLSHLRTKKGYSSISEFAMQNDLPLIQYWRIEKGKTNITIKSLVKLLAIHEMTLRDFFCVMRET